jgi:hypothetical protein
VSDSELLSKLSGCKLPVSETLPDHCGPAFVVTLTWEIEGDSLTFSGASDGNAWWGLEPWTKIG